jgi:RNA polymerase sigma-70 factor (ECF subfamily)
VAARQDSARNVTALLRAWKAGDLAAGDQLTDLVYDELRRVARRQLRREGRQATLNTNELVHESYLRLVGQAGAFENRAHFFALAATLMRRILVDRARQRRAAKRGGAEHHVTLDEQSLVGLPRSIDVIALDGALDELATFDPEQSRLVELHFFGGLSFEEVASVLGVSPATVYREWRIARLWLLKRLGGETGRTDEPTHSRKS